MYINDAILHFLILEHLCSNIGTWNMDQEATSGAQFVLISTERSLLDPTVVAQCLEP